MRNSTEVETKIIHVRGQEKNKQEKHLFVLKGGSLLCLSLFFPGYLKKEQCCRLNCPCG